MVFYRGRLSLFAMFLDLRNSFNNFFHYEKHRTEVTEVFSDRFCQWAWIMFQLLFFYCHKIEKCNDFLQKLQSSPIHPILSLNKGHSNDFLLHT